MTTPPVPTRLVAIMFHGPVTRLVMLWRSYREFETEGKINETVVPTTLGVRYCGGGWIGRIWPAASFFHTNSDDSD